MSSILLAVFVQVLSISARAEVQVTGAPDAIKVDAKETSVEELLTALRKAYGLQYWSSANLSRSVSGTYAGSLQQVVSRALMLQGYDFIAETSEHGTIVAVYGKSAAPGSDVNLVVFKTAPPTPPMAAPLPSRSRPNTRSGPARASSERRYPVLIIDGGQRHPRYQQWPVRH